MRLRLAMALIGCALAACAARDLRPAERLDPKTAVNVTLMAEPWVYARAVPMLAANARDYLNVGIAETNRAGTRAYWLGVVAWSTIDRSPFATDVPIEPAQRVTLAWDGSILELSASPRGRADPGLSAPAFTAPADRFRESWYPLTIADVLRLGADAPVTVSLTGADGRITTYDAWQSSQAPVREFLKATGLDGA